MMFLSYMDHIHLFSITNDCHWYEAISLSKNVTFLERPPWHLFKVFLPPTHTPSNFISLFQVISFMKSVTF